MRQLRRWKRLWRRSLTRSHKRTSMGLSEVVWTVQQVYYSRRRLLRWGLEFHVWTINKSPHTKKSGNLFNDPRISRPYPFAVRKDNSSFTNQTLLTYTIYVTTLWRIVFILLKSVNFILFSFLLFWKLNTLILPLFGFLLLFSFLPSSHVLPGNFIELQFINTKNFMFCIFSC